MFENLKIKSPRDYCIKRQGQNAYDLDCHKFVNCWHSNAVIQTCHPPSLVFNPKLGVCDWITSPGKYCTKYSNKFIRFNMQFQILKLFTNSSDVFTNFSQFDHSNIMKALDWLGGCVQKLAIFA